MYKLSNVSNCKHNKYSKVHQSCYGSELMKGKVDKWTCHKCKKEAKEKEKVNLNVKYLK